MSSMLAMPPPAIWHNTGKPVALDFKWWDNPQKIGDIMDTYLSGDVAPEGRFSFR